MYEVIGPAGLSVPTSRRPKHAPSLPAVASVFAPLGIAAAYVTHLRRRETRRSIIGARAAGRPRRGRLRPCPWGHEITSSARSSSVCGTASPIAFAVARWITSSTLLGCGLRLAIVPLRRTGGGRLATITHRANPTQPPCPTPSCNPCPPANASASPFPAAWTPAPRCTGCAPRAPSPAPTPPTWASPTRATTTTSRARPWPTAPRSPG